MKFSDLLEAGVAGVVAVIAVTHTLQIVALSNRIKVLEEAQTTIAIKLPFPPPPPTQKLEKQFFDVYLTVPSLSNEI